MAIRTEAQIDLARVDDGEQGATFTPSVDSSGNISWTNDKGLPNPPTQNIMGPSSQYFWYESTGTEAGAHITEVPEEEWSDPTDPNYHSGGNLLARSNGIAVRDGLVELASFGTSGVVIGQNDDTRLYIDNDSVFSTNARGFPTFEINSLPSGTYNNKDEWFKYNNESPFECVFRWNCTSINNNVQCYDSSFNRVVGLNPQPTLSNNTAIFDATQCTQLQSNSVKYILMGYTAVGAFPYFTFGERGAGTIGKYSTSIGETCVASNDDSYAEGLSTEASGVGAHAEGNGSNASGGYSHAEGYGTKASGTQAHSEGHDSIASGSVAHAEGYETIADGDFSHAQNYGTKASSDNQTALGKYNVEDSVDDYAVIIGNGTADNARSNALTVSWYGDVTASGEIKGKTVSEVPSITSITTGTLVEAYAVQNGKVVTLTLGVKKSTATAVNANVFAATLESKYCPKYLVNGVGYSGASAGVLQLLNTGALNVHIVGAQLNANTNIYISATYVIE